MLSVELIESVLIEQDPEGLISMGAPLDEYSGEANEIYNRLIRKLNGNFIFDSENAEISKLIKYISVITFVMYERFGSGIQYNGTADPTFFISEKFISNRLSQCKIIAKLIYDLDNKDSNEATKT